MKGDIVKSSVNATRNRDSNIELLRIIAMFLVLVVHANFLSLGIPTRDDSINNALPTLGRFFFQSLSIGCVDLFVLISGWFGIRPKLKGFLNFIFQCLFFLCGIYIICLITGYSSFSVTGLLECFVMTKHNWFIKSYILLYILAPILNTYVDHSSEKELRYLLLFFYIFQTIYGWITSSAQFFVSGYSTTSFIGLYLLARYVRLYRPKWARMDRRNDLLIFITIVVVWSVITYTLCRLNAYEVFPPLHARVFSYINPLIITAVLFLLLFFVKLKIQNVVINKIAASSFAVFLLHQNANIVPLFKSHIQYLYECFSGLLCVIYIFIYLFIIFWLAILIDRVRLLCWNFLLSLNERKLNG